MKYQLIIFDWDGTLMDSVPRIVSSMQSLARHLGLPMPSVTAIHDIIGLSLPVALQQLFSCNVDEAQDFIAVYRDYYVVKDPTPTPLFEHTISTLQWLRDNHYRMAVATGKARAGLERAWIQSDSGSFFIASRCADEVASKPDPQMLHEILRQTETNAEHALMIGDSVHDLTMANNAGVDAIGVTYGVHNKERLTALKPKALLDNISQLPDFLGG